MPGLKRDRFKRWAEDLLRQVREEPHTDAVWIDRVSYALREAFDEGARHFAEGQNDGEKPDN